MMIYIILIFVFLSILILTYAILVGLMYKERPVDKLRYYSSDFQIQERLDSNKGKTTLLKSLPKLFPRIKINRKRVSKLELEIIKADVPLTVEELFIIKLLSTLVLAFVAYSILKDFVVLIPLSILVWNIPKFIITKRKKKRVKMFNEQINEAIMIISNSLKAGYSFLQALSVVVEETQDPLSKEFKKLLKEMRLGISTEDAFNNMLKRMDSEDLKLIVNAILIQKDIGGNLSEILDNISNTIRERQKIKNELNTLTAQGRLSGLIIMLIPIFLGMIIYLFNREFIMLLFNTNLGLFMLISAVINQIIGFIVIRNIINVQM